MHANIKLTRNLGDLLRYHQRKVERGQAEYLHGANLLKDGEELSLKQKQFHFERLAELNDTVRRKTLHIFLSWHKDDRLDNNTMRSIARDYMQGMGLDKQPYLVYRHRDSAHPHAHIVTSLIRKDGTRIGLWQKEMHHGMELSRQLELKYGLYQAGRRLSDEEWARLHPAQKLVYGKTPLKPTINAVLERVIPTYKYTSLDELNAVLRGYHLEATRGRERSITHRHQGLLYIPLDSSGNREEIYVKASALRSKPTLRHLQTRFAGNYAAREEHRQRLTTAIDWIFHREQVSLDALRQHLQKENIRMIGDPGATDRKLGVYYIDQLTKAVFEGQSLGRSYSGEGLLARFVSEEEYQQRQAQKQAQKQEQKQRQVPRQRFDHY